LLQVKAIFSGQGAESADRLKGAIGIIFQVADFGLT
jgi:hypothetical protein